LGLIVTPQERLRVFNKFAVYSTARRPVRRSLNAQHNAIFDTHLEAKASQVSEHVFIERGGWEADGEA
jgi:hypothetical protein